MNTNEIINDQKEIKENFIFQIRKNYNLKDISEIAFMKGDDNSLSYSKSRNIINYNNNLIYDISKFSEKEFNIFKSKIVALEIIREINNIEDKEELLEKIYKALSYDDTADLILSTALEKLYYLNLKEEYLHLLKEYRMIISEDLIIKNNNFYKIENIEGFFIAKNKEEIKNYLISVLQLLIKFVSRLISSKIIKYKIKDDIIAIINYNEFSDNDNLKEFAKIFQKIKFTKKKYFNQPIEYNSNNVLYYFKIINLIFDIVLTQDKNEDNIIQISFNKNKLYQCWHIQGFINNIIIQYLSNHTEITKEIDYCIKFLVYFLDCDFLSEYNTFENNFIIRHNNQLTREYTENYLEDNSMIISDYSILNIIKLYNDKFTLENEGEIITFYYNKYDTTVLKEVIGLLDLRLVDIKRYTNIDLNQFQSENFFTKIELDYLISLLRDIINSKLFEELFQLYSDEKLLSFNVLKDTNIQNYIINNIIFLPYDETMFDTQAITFNHNAQIIISGYPKFNPKKCKNIKIHHILELSIKLIRLLHEYIHAIKRYLCICTNGLISPFTNDDSNFKDKEEYDSGFLLEFLLFGWKHKNYKINESELKNYNNNDLIDKFINVETALKILDPDLYNYNINSTRNILYNNINDINCINFNKKERNEKLNKFLNDMGFNSEEKINKLKMDKTKISAKRNTFQGNKIYARFNCGNVPRKFRNPFDTIA